jgi:hypothetical protein
VEHEDRLVIARRLAAIENPSAASHLHDFHMGAARCSMCGLTAAEAGVQSGGRIVGPSAASDDGWRVAPAPSRRVLADNGAPARLLSGYADDRPMLTRTDVVAYLYGLRRRPGEDDASLATRVRRGAGNVRHAVPPMEWSPPPGFRLGDDWQQQHTRRRAEEHTIEANPRTHTCAPTLLCCTCGLSLEARIDRLLGEDGDLPMKRVN